ncbi:MAG TPA: glycosyltransferase family 2 protein [Spirochaetota bacterium]|nr:glycosyltransferase family 2 protein [Spirochaetota bacterium]
MPFFSIIIPAYNRYDQLKRSIDSVLAQTFSDYELIVVDDGSTDRTPEIESLYHGKLRYIKQQNLGVSAARNCGILHSRSEHITFLDSDDEWNPRKLMSHKNYIEHNPLVRIHQCDDLWMRNGKSVNMSARYIKSEGDIFLKSLELCTISPSSVSMTAGMFDTYGMFDEKMPACEDYDLWLRITPFESTGLINEKLITRYSGHEGQLSAEFQGMDRFRVYSILKLLDESGDKLTTGQRNAAAECALKKISILKNGSDKRGNSEFSALLKQVRESFMDGCCTRKYYQSLLQI